MKNITARSEQIHQYICDLKKSGNKKLVARLTDSPTYICGICGETSNSPENLCDNAPRQLRLPLTKKH